MYFTRSNSDNTKLLNVNFDTNEECELVDFARVISLRLDAYLKQGTLAIHNLPHDISTGLVLGAWYAGWRIAVIPSHLSTASKQLLLRQIEANLIVSDNSIEESSCESQSHECMSLVLNPHSVLKNLFTWLENGDRIDSRDSSYAWTETETALILFTSGSTGLPKGVCHSLMGVLASAERFVQHFNISGTDRLLNTALLHTMSGFRCSIIVPLITGCTVNNLPIDGNVGQVLELLDREQSTVMISGPNIIHHLSMLGERVTNYISYLRFILCTGAKLARQDRETLFSTLNLKILDYYGMTETGGLIIADSENIYDPANKSIGKACEGVVVKVLDSDGVESARGHGELRVYCSSLFLGYLGSQLEQRSYFDTGDVVNIDNGDFVTWLYRCKSGLKATTSTEWIYPDTVDLWLRRNTSIEDVHISVSYDLDDRPQFKTEITGIDQSQWLEWSTETYRKLLLELGSDYRLIVWTRVESIVRSNLGKYEKSIY